MKSIGITFLFICILALGIPSLISMEDTEENIFVFPASVDSSVCVLQSTPERHHKNEDVKSDCFGHVSVDIYYAYQQPQSFSMDSNGNPLSTLNYQDAVYYAFHPDDRFG